MNLSIVIVSYKSDHLIENIILSCPANFEIIIIENSKNKEIYNEEGKRMIDSLIENIE